MNSDPAEDLLVGELPEEIGEAASDGDFERVKSWLAGGSASAPRSINASDQTEWSLLHWTLVSELTPEHVEFARYLLSRGAQQVLRLRSLVAHGRSKLRPRGRDARQERALEFVVRQGDNGIVWNILSFWRATA